MMSHPLLISCIMSNEKITEQVNCLCRVSPKFKYLAQHPIWNSWIFLPLQNLYILAFSSSNQSLKVLHPWSPQNQYTLPTPPLTKASVNFTLLLPLQNLYTLPSTSVFPILHPANTNNMQQPQQLSPKLCHPLHSTSYKNTLSYIH